MGNVIKKMRDAREKKNCDHQDALQWLLKTNITSIWRSSCISTTSRRSSLTYKKKMDKGHAKGGRNFTKKVFMKKRMSNHWKSLTWNTKEMQMQALHTKTMQACKLCAQSFTHKWVLSLTFTIDPFTKQLPPSNNLVASFSWAPKWC
jgi:hypothetical protein